ncbi:MAG: FAD-dependent thymidylate synthase [Limisphaerales bacterium]
MKVTQVAICPSEASKRAGRPALTPELLAASGARYSRNNEGLDSILSKIDPDNLEKSVDSIFRMVDYGHQSIADMVPVAMFMDEISIWLAYYIWTLCPTAGGQESSTRYIRLSVDGLIEPERLGIRSEEVSEWHNLMGECFQAYQASVKVWEDLAAGKPALMGIPKALLLDPSESAQKKVARMRRNYAFDRARYFLPVAAATNVMLVMSARGWVNLCQHLLSHPLPEFQRLGEMIRGELEISAPRMIKHARATESHKAALNAEFQKSVQGARTESPQTEEAAIAHVSVDLPQGVGAQELADDLKFHTNRYAPVGSSLQRTSVRFAWSRIAFAEIRDLNRHRTGTKYCQQIPSGFYFAADQLPADAAKQRSTMESQAEVGRKALAKARGLLANGDLTYPYWTLLGAEFPFEHTTTADKFLYEAELRTGLGAHYRYAKHLKDALTLWYERFPATKGLVLEGSAEPE